MERIKIVLFIVCFLSLPTISKCQIIGDHISTVRELEDATLCSSSQNALLYCPTDATKTSYGFNRAGYVHSITKFTIYKTYSQAQSALNTRLSEFDIDPYVSNGYYTFFYSDDHQLSFTIKNTPGSSDYVLMEGEGVTSLMD